VAVALNGTVWAVGPTFERTADGGRFRLLLPETAFRQGPNEVQVLAVDEAGTLRPLALAAG
jgi:hypothetical protein